MNRRVAVALLGLLGLAHAAAGDVLTEPAAEQLMQEQLPSGLFGDDPDLGRQGVALLGLAQYGEASGNGRAREATTRGLQAFIDHSLPIGKGPVQEILEDMGIFTRWQRSELMRVVLDALGLLYSDKVDGTIVSGDGSYGAASPAATALALLSELSYFRLTGSSDFAAMRHHWLLGLQALHVPGRGFRIAPDQLVESGEVDGIAWLALAEYSRTIPGDVDAVAFLANVDDYMLGRYGEEPDTAFIRWGAKAAVSRSTMTGDARFARFSDALATGR